MSKKEDIDELLAMYLHDEIMVNDEYWVLRVPGGWMYTSLGDMSRSSVFVPEPK